MVLITADSHLVFDIHAVYAGLEDGDIVSGVDDNVYAGSVNKFDIPSLAAFFIKSKTLG